MKNKVEISHRTIIFTVFFVVLLWFLYFIRDIIFLFFVSLLLTVIINPITVKFSKLGIGKAISALIVYIVVIAVFVFLVASFVPLIVDQTGKLLGIFPSLIENIGLLPFVGGSFVSEIARVLGNLSEIAVKFTFSAFSNVLSLVTVLVLSFYLLLERDKLEEEIDSALGKEWKRKIKLFLDLWEKELGGWLRGQLLLMFFVGFLTFVGLVALRIPFSLPLALLAGVFEIIPIIGPPLSAIPAVIVGFNISPVLGLLVVLLYFLVQQLENHLLVPKIMQRSTGISPAVVILSLAVGLKLAGFVGVLLAVPVYITMKVAIRVFFVK